MKLKTLLPKKLNEANTESEGDGMSQLEYNVDPILLYFYELRDPMEIMNDKGIDRNLAAKYIKREALEYASKHGMHLTGEELQYILSDVIRDLDIKPWR